MSSKITCPSCGHEFELAAAIEERITAEARVEIENELKRERALIQKAADDRLARELADRLRDKDAELNNARKKASDAAHREEALLRRERELADKEIEQSLELEKKLNDEREKLHKTAHDRIARELAEKLREKDAELDSARRKVGDATQREEALLRRERELADKELAQSLELEKKLVQERTQIKQDADARIARELTEKLREKDAELENARKRVSDSAQREESLLRRERQLAEQQEEQSLEIEKRLRDERAKLQEAANERAARELDEKLRAKDEELESVRKKAAEAAQREAAVLRREAELADKERTQELEVERKLGRERDRIRESAEAIAAERYALREQEQTLSTQRLRKQIDELTTQLTRKSQELQGEAQEVELKSRLIRMFPRDEISDVAVGASGADLVHRVRDNLGNECGVILWESKRTKGWSNDWLPKLRDDQRIEKAECAVLVTQAMPQGVEEFAEIDGTWICNWGHAVRLAAVLRSGLLDVSKARSAVEGQTGKMQLVYNYLTGHEFKQRVEGVLEALSEMENDLRSEQRAMKSIWSKRERQLDRAHLNMAGIYGDLRGLSSSQIATIPELELDASTETVFLESGDTEEGTTSSIEENLLPQFAQLLFDLVPVGESVGNKSLFLRFRDESTKRFGLNVSLTDFERCRENLISENRLRRGRGRGGSVMRAAPSAVPPSLRRGPPT